MLIAVLSDIHDHIWNLKTALERARGAEVLLFCGDFCAPFTLAQMAQGFAGPIHAVFGNNDGDRFLLTRIAASHPHVELHGELARLELGEMRIAVNHYPEIAAEIAHGGRFDAVFYGHNHHHAIDRVADCDLINPGEVMGRFGRPTFILYDTDHRRAETVELGGLTAPAAPAAPAPG